MQSRELGVWALCFLPKNVLPFATAGIAFWSLLRNGSYASPLTHKRCNKTSQLSCRGDDGSFLSVPPATLGQPQAPAPQITIDATRSENVLRPLHQQSSQIGMAFLADVRLRFALPRVSPSGCTPDSSPRRDSCEDDALPIWSLGEVIQDGQGGSLVRPLRPNELPIHQP
jgi:hypothetical protein